MMIGSITTFISCELNLLNNKAKTTAFGFNNSNANLTFNVTILNKLVFGQDFFFFFHANICKLSITFLCRYLFVVLKEHIEVLSFCKCLPPQVKNKPAPGARACMCTTKQPKHPALLGLCFCFLA